MRVRAGCHRRGRGVAAAHSARAYALTRLGRRTEAQAAGDAAVVAASARGRAGADAATLALALLRRGEARYRIQQAQGGLEDGRRSLALFERLADLSGQARALWVVGANLIALGQVHEAQQAVARGLAIARACGDNLALGQLLNLFVFWNSDPAANVRALREARSAFQRAGRLDRLVVIEVSLAATFDHLGLPRRAWRLLEPAKQRALAMGSHDVLLTLLQNAIGVAVRLGWFDDAHRLADELEAHLARLKLPSGPAHLAGSRAFIALEEGRAALAMRLLTPLLHTLDETAGIGNRLELQTNLARALLAQGQPKAALRHTSAATALHREKGLGWIDGMHPATLWWQHSRALAACGRSEEAWAALRQAHALLMERVREMRDEGLRRSTLNKDSIVREVVLAWLEQAAVRGLPEAERLAHLRLPSELGEPFQRLVDTGLRLNEIREAAELEHFVVDELTELSGADRVLLVFEGASGLQLAGALLPRSEDTPEGQAALLQAVTPWLMEARRTRAVALRHGPDGVPPERQRSCLVAPLVAQRELLGYLYADLDGEFGCFTEADRDLLSTLAAQAAVALANLRTQEGLERQVAERTAVARAAQLAAEQRAAELAVINSIQQAVGAALDFQAIVDAVGDKLREVFASGDLSIRWYEESAHTLTQLYSYEHGVRLRLPPRRVVPGDVVDRFLKERRVWLLNSRAALEAKGLRTIAGTDPELSGLFVPMLAGDRMLGAIALGNHERENAFTQDDVRLVSTVASSMGVALLNAKSYEAERQRAAELALINTVQKALAGELSLQGVYDAVGMKLREVFPGCGVGIRRYDAASGLMHFPFWWHDAERDAQVEPAPLMGLGAEVVRTKRTLLIDHDTAAAVRRLGSRLVSASGTMPESQLVVPMLAGDQVVGMLDLNHLTRAKAFSESDVRLLETIAASMSVALENARLFSETQRLLNETERRSSELAVINSIQQGIAGSLDFQAIVDLVGDKLRELFRTGDLAIYWNDEPAQRTRGLYSYEHGVRLPPDELPHDPERPIWRALLAGQAIVVDSDARAAALGIILVPGTDRPLCSVFVPVRMAERLIAYIVVESHERRDAFDQAQVHLLATVAASLQRRHPARHQPVADRRDAGGGGDRRHRAAAAGLLPHRLPAPRRGRAGLAVPRHGRRRGDGLFGPHPARPDAQLPSARARLAQAASRAGLAGGRLARAREEHPASHGHAVGAAAAAAARLRPGRPGRAGLPAQPTRALQRRRHRTGAVLRRPGRDRDRERAPVQRDAGGAAAADGLVRHPARDQPVAHGCDPGL
jgi:GAF domain-containing protein